MGGWKGTEDLAGLLARAGLSDRMVAHRGDADSVKSSLAKYLLVSVSSSSHKYTCLRWHIVPVEGSVDSWGCLLYTSPSPRDGLLSRMPSSA